MMGTQTDAAPSCELSIGRACEEYSKSVRLTLTHISHQLNEALLRSSNELDELCLKISARASFLEKNPTFLSCIVYDKRSIKQERLLEFDEVKITLKEHAKRIQERLEEVEKFHGKIFDLVKSHGRDDDDKAGTSKEIEEDFQDCIDKPRDESEEPKDTKLQFVSIKDCTSFDKITVQKNAFSSEMSVGIESPVKFQVFPDIIPDVQRRRPQEDLHGRMIQQVVATDSLEGFLKLMERKPISPKRKTKGRRELAEKYAGSLYFFPKEVRKKPSAIRRVSPVQSSRGSTSASTCCSLLVTSSQPCPMTNQDRTRKIRQTLNRTKLKCYDLLDDIDHNDVQPIKSEYPRRDNIYPLELQEAKSYLHRMMEENEKVWKKLIQPVDVRKKSQVEVKKVSTTSVKKKFLPKVKQARNLMEYLTAPEQKILSHIPQSLIVMPVKIIYDNVPTKETSDSKPGAVLITDLTKADETISMPNVLRSDLETSGHVAKDRTKIFDQIKGLKTKNDKIQKNIQKAIDVIENKMIDLISSPEDATSAEAFHAMEQEITSVLDLMKQTGQEDKKKVKEDRKDVKEAKKPEKEEVIKPTKVKVMSAGVKRFVPSDTKSGGDSVNELFKKGDKSLDATDDKPEKNVEEIVVMKDEPKTVKKRVNGVRRGSSVDRARVGTTGKQMTEAKKAANIEEGERLLSQVDDVIKKIDNIYTKFYDEGKSRPKKDPGFGSVAEFFGGLKKTLETPLVEEKKYYQLPRQVQRVQNFCQTAVYFPILIPNPPPSRGLESKPPKSDHMETKPPKSDHSESKKAKKEDSFEIEPPQEQCRHDCTLKSFYTLFFTSIFIALNFDYVS